MKYLVEGLYVLYIILMELFTIKQFYHLAMANTKADYIGSTVIVIIFLFLFVGFLIVTIKKTYKNKQTNTIEEKNEKNNKS